MLRKLFSKKFKLSINDTAGFLAGTVGQQKHRLLTGEFDVDPGQVQYYFSASVTARANGSVLFVQLQEILQHNPNVSEFVQPWMRPLLQNKTIKRELKEFFQGKPQQTTIKAFGTPISDESTGTCPDLETLYFQVTHFKTKDSDSKKIHLADLAAPASLRNRLEVHGA